MEVRQLRYVVTLAEELHFGRAAAREHLVQSALSQHIRRLGREIGVLLFTRTTHRVEITPAGEVFLAEARRILTHLQLAVVAARLECLAGRRAQRIDYVPGPDGTFSVDVLGGRVTPELVARVALDRQVPLTELRESDSGGLEQLFFSLTAGKADHSQEAAA